MSGAEDRGGTTRGAMPYVLIAVVVGVAAAVLLGMALGGGGPQVAVNPSSSPAFVPSGPSSLAPSPSFSFAAPSASAPASSPTTAVVTPIPSLAATQPPVVTAPPPPTQPPVSTPRPTPTPNTDPAIVAFTVPKFEDCTDDSAGTITLSWTVVRATGATLSIDGPGIFDSYDASDSADVPFACSHEQLTHTYTLRTTGGTGPAATSTKTVTAAPPRITTFTLGPANCPTDSGSVGVTLTYAIEAATGAVLMRDDQIYTTYSSKQSSNGLNVVYECANASHAFRLTTTGGFGTEATKQVVVQRSLP